MSKRKKEELNMKYRKLYWLLAHISELTVENKLLIYHQILKPVWTYGIQLWGCTKKSNMKMIQIFQNKVLHGIVNAHWYIRNIDLHRDLQISLVTEEIRRHAIKHRQRLLIHENTEMENILDTNIIRRLKLSKLQDLKE